jgi:hypothetical protein
VKPIAIVDNRLWREMMLYYSVVWQHPLPGVPISPLRAEEGIACGGTVGYLSDEMQLLLHRTIYAFRIHQRQMAFSKESKIAFAGALQPVQIFWTVQIKCITSY